MSITCIKDLQTVNGFVMILSSSVEMNTLYDLFRGYLPHTSFCEIIDVLPLVFGCAFESVLFSEMGWELLSGIWYLYLFLLISKISRINVLLALFDLYSEALFLSIFHLTY